MSGQPESVPAATAVSFGTETTGSAAVSPSYAPGNHAACDAEIARLRARAEAAEARGAEVREVIRTFFTVHGNNTAASLTGARDLAEGIRQVLDREPLPTQRREGDRS